MLDSEEAYRELAAELKIYDSIFAEFAQRHGFDIDEPNKGPRTWLGRIPRRYFHREHNGIKLFVDLCIEMERHGKRVTGPSPSNLYSMGAGGSIDREKTRLSCSFGCFEDVMLKNLGGILLRELDEAWFKLRNWDLEYLEKHGEYSKLA